MTKEQLLATLRRAAAENGNRPPGEVAFFSAARITRRHLWDAGIRTYGDLCELAGFPRNRLTTRFEPDRLFEPLALLTTQLGRFPNHTDREIAHRNDASFPSSEAFRTATGDAPALPVQLLEWCRSKPKYADAAVIIEKYVSQERARAAPAKRGARVVNGYVYLLRYGKSGRDYKVGMSEDLPRRHSQIASLFPGDLRIVHVIETDDPAGIERYWLQRFESKRVPTKKEIFRLSPEDIAAFKCRKYQ